MALLLQIEMLRGTFFPIRSVPHCHILLVGQRKKSTRFSETIVSTWKVRRVVVLSDAGFRPLALQPDDSDSQSLPLLLPRLTLTLGGAYSKPPRRYLAK